MNKTERETIADFHRDQYPWIREDAKPPQSLADMHLQAIRSAILAERERCANLVVELARGDGNTHDLKVAHLIAALIRKDPAQRA